MIGFLRRLLKDRRGNVLAIACAALPMVVGCAGLATDTIQWTLWRRQLQRAADSAAIAGVYDRYAANGDTSTVSTTVTHDLSLNQHTWMGLASGYPQLAYPADSGVKTNQVSVTLAIQQPLPFSSLFMSSAPLITANSTAATIPAGGDACFNARTTNAGQSGILISGNADIYAPDCVMYSNSPASNSAYAKGSSSVTAEAVAAVGGIQSSNNWSVQSYRPYSPAIPDPFANVTPAAADMVCSTKTIVQGGKNVTSYYSIDENTDFSQVPTGTNCFSSLSVASNRTLNLPNGTYYINGGDANIQGNISCSSCTIVLTNYDQSSTATIGQFKVNASSNVNLTAPTDSSNKFKGIAVYQDRRAVDQSGKPNLINGNSGSLVTGALYFPKQELDYNGTGNTTATCTMFVAYRLNFTGNSSTSNKFKSLSQCASAGLPQSNAIYMVRLVA